MISYLLPLSIGTLKFILCSKYVVVNRFYLESCVFSVEKQYVVHLHNTLQSVNLCCANSGIKVNLNLCCIWYVPELQTSFLFIFGVTNWIVVSGLLEVSWVFDFSMFPMGYVHPWTFETTSEIILLPVNIFIPNITDNSIVNFFILTNSLLWMDCTGSSGILWLTTIYDNSLIFLLVHQSFSFWSTVKKAWILGNFHSLQA